ncbi:hypothetical protein Egran_06012 [Elaphomyces granulatus]|uniref:Uncharacterized protein n=1 Tax=Elaphomyces granulatus TaxID=519963 RepID=A0A232LPX7_9EURO|nr:hypothetical protein Egran_06012 [Elaphomyces granulatus]
MELEDDQEGLDDSSSDDDNDDGNNTHDNNGNAAKTKTKSAAKDAERRGKLPDFWYNLINQPVCLRETIWDYFKEPNESRRMVPADRCCSKCQPKYDLGLLNLDRYPKYYTYVEKGPKANKMGKQIGKTVVFPNMPFVLNSTCFLSSSQQELLERYGRQIFGFKDLEEHLGTWEYLDTYGHRLLEVIRDCRKGSQQSAGRRRLAEPPTSNSQPADTLSTQMVSSNDSPGVVMPVTPSSNQSRKRKPLQQIQKNITSKRFSDMKDLAQARAPDVSH